MTFEHYVYFYFSGKAGSRLPCAPAVRGLVTHTQRGWPESAGVACGAHVRVEAASWGRVASKAALATARWCALSCAWRAPAVSASLDGLRGGGKASCAVAGRRRLRVATTWWSGVALLDRSGV